MDRGDHGVVAPGERDEAGLVVDVALDRGHAWKRGDLFRVAGDRRDGMASAESSDRRRDPAWPEAPMSATFMCGSDESMEWIPGIGTNYDGDGFACKEGTFRKPGFRRGTAGAPPDPYAAGCPTRMLLDRIGDKWTVLVLGLVCDRPRRFNALRRDIEGLTQKMLSQTLKAMERDGLITRTVLPTAPVSVEYAVTPLGRRSPPRSTVSSIGRATTSARWSARQRRYDEGNGV